MTFQNQEIPYFHGLMEDSLINDGANGVSYQIAAGPARPDLGDQTQQLQAFQRVYAVVSSNIQFLYCVEYINIYLKLLYSKIHMDVCLHYFTRIHVHRI